MAIAVQSTTLREMNGRRHEAGSRVLSTDKRFYRGMYLEISRADGSMKAIHECIGSGSSVVAPVLDRALSELDSIIGIIPYLADPEEAGLIPYEDFVQQLRRIGISTGIEAVTLEIQKKIEDVIRPRAGVNTSRIAVDMMSVHRGVENETSRILEMLYSQEQMDHQSKASMSKLSEEDAREDVRLRLPAGNDRRGTAAQYPS